MSKHSGIYRHGKRVLMKINPSRSREGLCVLDCASHVRAKHSRSHAQTKFKVASKSARVMTPGFGECFAPTHHITNSFTARRVNTTAISLRYSALPRKLVLSPSF